MANLKIGDIVARKSHGMDVLFKVAGIKTIDKDKVFTLKGIAYRIEADAPETDLILQPEHRINEDNMRFYRVIDSKTKSIVNQKEKVGFRKGLFRSISKENAKKFSKSGKVLHIDGDNDYLQSCTSQYVKLGMDIIGKYIPEKEQPSAVYGLLEEYRPDILVLTGHDGLIKGENNYTNIRNYRNSRYFVESVKEARKFESDLDSLIIFAGACQSMYNDLINAGANFASSPYRVLIHALDPVLICQKIAFTSVEKTIDPIEVINGTISGIEGIGGLQTRGKYRDGFPLEPYTK